MVVVSNQNDKIMDIRQLQRDLEALRDSGKMSDYHRDLLKWARNVDQRYAWVVLTACFLVMMSAFGPYRIYSLIFAAVTKQGIYTREEASWPVSMIFTVENISGSFVTFIAFIIGFKRSILVGGLLMSLSNLAAYFSRSLVLDVIFIGFTQGFGYAFIFMPYMEIINGYFVRYRNVAFGVSLCGGTIANFFLTPIFQWILSNYEWRAGYLGVFCVNCICVLVVPLLEPNFRPIPPVVNAIIAGKSTTQEEQDSWKRTLSRMSMKSINVGSCRLSRVAASNLFSRKSSLASIEPWAGLEENKPANSQALQVVLRSNNKFDSQQQSSIDQYEVLSLSEALNGDGDGHLNEPTKANNSSRFDNVLDILKLPAFHLIWFMAVVYFWTFSIFCLVIVDYGMDHGLSKTTAESLLNYIAVGELSGRIGLSCLADLNMIPIRITAALDLVALAALMMLMTQATGFYCIAGCTLAVFGLTSLLYVLLNGLLVEYVGEQRVTLAFGLVSCISGVLVSLRPYAVGYFRDYHRSYDPLIMCLASICLVSATLWVIEPILTRLFTKRRTEGEKTIASVV